MDAARALPGDAGATRCPAPVAQLFRSGIVCGPPNPRRDEVREEQRIVAFVDLIDSTAVAERIGNLRFHALLSDVFSRLSLLVGAFGGEVHRYVGDALIATWPLGTPCENARSIECLFAGREELRRTGGELLSRHGHAPRVRASIHCGPLVAGALGGMGDEVALVGDAMNTAARIEQACRITGHDVLVSRPFLDRTSLPSDLVAISTGDHRLRGKSALLELFALERRDAAGFHIVVRRGSHPPAMAVS